MLRLGMFLIFAFLGLFFLYPLGHSISSAFFNKGSFTLSYFSLLFSNPMLLESLSNSLLIALISTVLCFLIALPLASLQNTGDFPAKKILMGLLLLPMVIPPFVGAIGIQRFFAKYGTLNDTLLNLGWIQTPIPWLEGSGAFFAVVILEALHLYPILYLNLAAAMANIDPALNEACETLGIPKRKRFFSITLPLIRPGLLAGGSLVFIWSLTDLGTPLLVGMKNTLPVRIFNYVNDIDANPVGFALVFITVVITLAIYLLSKKWLGKHNYPMQAKGHISSKPTPFTWYQLPFVYLFLGTILAAACLPHVMVILNAFSTQWFMSALPSELGLDHFFLAFKLDLSALSIRNSLIFAGLATTLDLILGLFIAYLITRKPSRWTSLLDTLTMAPLAIPGIVIACGYVIAFSGTFLDPIHNPAPLLVIAYAVRRLPYLVRSACAGYQQVSPSLEEASALCGASPLRTNLQITFPLISANLIAGCLLCFSYAMLDVSDSMILAMKDQYYPMTKAIYVLFLEQGSGENVASALGVIAMLVLSACILGSSLILGKKMGEMFKG